MLETNKNSGRDGNEKLETITVVPHKERRNETKPASPSWFVAKINPVSRFIGALILCIPMFFTLDVVSASVAFGLEMLLLWIGGGVTGRVHANRPQSYDRELYPISASLTRLLTWRAYPAATLR